MMKTALITGGAARIGEQIVKTLHKNNFKIIIHCNQSIEKAKLLCDKLNSIHINTAKVITGDLSNLDSISKITDSIESLDLLVNNASVFYPRSVEDSDNTDWENILNINLRAPFFLSKGLSQKLANNAGSIINIIDIHSERPLKNHAIYNISKAGLKMLTQSLAKELAPQIRVNGVSPGSILWPEASEEISDVEKKLMLERIALNKQGSPQDISDTVLFLANSGYITGQIINIDGGRTLNQ